MKFFIIYFFLFSIYPCDKYSIEHIGNIKEPLLEETSGIEVSRKYKNLIWAHNDSGDEARFFAFSEKGESRGEFKLSGAKHKDWEDMALAKCPTFSKSSKEDCLYFGDIGDNPFERKKLTIYIVKEPAPLKAGQIKKVNVYHQYQIKLDTPARNFETLLVDGDDLILFSKSDAREKKKFKTEGNSLIYRFKMTKTKKVLAKKTGNINLLDLAGFKEKNKKIRWQNYLSWLTAGDYNEKERKLVLLTYGLILEYKVNSWNNFKLVGSFELPKLPQAESVSYMSDGSILLVSEYRHQPLLKVACQK